LGTSLTSPSTKIKPLLTVYLTGSYFRSPLLSLSPSNQLKSSPQHLIPRQDSTEFSPPPPPISNKTTQLEISLFFFSFHVLHHTEVSRGKRKTLQQPYSLLLQSPQPHYYRTRRSGLALSATCFNASNDKAQGILVRETNPLILAWLLLTSFGWFVYCTGWAFFGRHEICASVAVSRRAELLSSVKTIQSIHPPPPPLTLHFISISITK